MKDMLYPIGTKFKTGGKHPIVCEVIDYLITFNLAGEVVKRRYVARHEFMHQFIIDNDIVATTIARGLI